MPDHAANGWNIPQWELVRREIGAQCAPVLAGVKPSNILISRQADSDVVEQCLLGTGIRCRLFGVDYWILAFQPTKDPVRDLEKIYRQPLPPLVFEKQIQILPPSDKA